MHKTIITLSLLAVMPVMAIEARPEPVMRYNSPNAAAKVTVSAPQTTSVSARQTTSVSASQTTSVSASQTTSVGAVSEGGSATTGPATATAAPSSAAITIHEASSPSKVRIENTPDPYAPSISPTAPCMGATSAGGSGPGFGFAFGTSWKSEPCMILEAARSFEQAGYREDALHIRCQSEYAAAAPSCQNLKKDTP